MQGQTKFSKKNFLLIKLNKTNSNVRGQNMKNNLDQKSDSGIKQK